MTTSPLNDLTPVARRRLLAPVFAFICLRFRRANDTRPLAERAKIVSEAGGSFAVAARAINFVDVIFIICITFGARDDARPVTIGTVIADEAGGASTIATRTVDLIDLVRIVRVAPGAADHARAAAIRTIIADETRCSTSWDTRLGGCTQREPERPAWANGFAIATGTVNFVDVSPELVPVAGRTANVPVRAGSNVGPGDGHA
jgi:hypothetical protein